MNEVIGHFTFHIDEDNKSLIGRYSNRNLSAIFSHQARLEPENQEQEGEFVGDYRADWDDIDGEGSSNLTIRFKEGTDNQIYTLSWSGDGSNYSGEAFIEEGKTLIGSYVRVNV